MHIGIEVEGRLKGIKTVFMDASELTTDSVRKFQATDASHVYISDHNNTLNYRAVSSLFKKYLVTLDVTDVHTEDIPDNVLIMLTMPTHFWQSVARLRHNDQVKFHSGKRDVLCSTKSSFVPTYPDEFDADKEL